MNRSRRRWIATQQFLRYILSAARGTRRIDELKAGKKNLHTACVCVCTPKTRSLKRKSDLG